MIITEYILVKTGNLEDMVEQVNKQIIRGWQPHGNMIFVPEYADNSGKTYVQPMVKYYMGEDK